MIDTWIINEKSTTQFEQYKSHSKNRCSVATNEESGIYFKVGLRDCW